MSRGPPPCWAAAFPRSSGRREARDAAARGRLTHAARSQLRVHRERLAVRAGALAAWPPRGWRPARERLRTMRRASGPLSLGHVAREAERVRSWRRLLTAYDVERQLERGYTLTLTAAGELVRSARSARRSEARS